ncbi:MAG: hypothetical protein R2697_14175 [Ilumatobacteraceae bacterium]
MTTQQAESLPGMLSGDTMRCNGGVRSPTPAATSPRLSRRRAVTATRSSTVRKIWTSFGEVADYIYLICRTSSDGPPHQGISGDHRRMDTPGIDVRPHQGHDHEPALLRGVHRRSGAAWVNPVGVEGNALKADDAPARDERGGIDRLVSNRAPFELACERWTDPIRGSASRSRHPSRSTGSMHPRHLRRSARRRRPPAPPALRQTEHEIEVSEFVAQVYGAEATVWNDVVHGLLYSPGYTIMGGTSNIMRNILGERVLGLPREPR